MLFIYGSLMPVRVMESVRHWKVKEQEHKSVMIQALPGLERQYIQLLDSWETIFAKTSLYASDWLDEWLSYPSRLPANAERHVITIVESALEQSRTYVDQLAQLIERITAPDSPSAARIVIQHAIRESDYYIGIMSAYRQAANSPGNREYEVRAPARQIPVGGHELLPLPYPYHALAPHIDEQTMRIHHDIHHRSCVDELNKAEKQLQAARESRNYELMKHWERELASHETGHYLHTLFWSSMSTYGGGEAAGLLARQIANDFGSFAAFKEQFGEAAVNIEGGGWVILAWNPRRRRLDILTSEKHRNPSPWDVIPLLPLDVWEHAYYLKHQNRRADYVKDWWNVVNWPYVNDRFAEARKAAWDGRF